MIDQFFTPPNVAREMVKHLPADFKPKAIADFTCGEGALLSAAESKFPNAKVIGNDLCPKIIKKLKHNHPSWRLSCSNFICDASVSRSNLRNFRGKVDLIVINPPFSQRGVKPACVMIDGDFFKVGQAFNCLVRSLQFLSKDGVLLGLLPDGCINSEKHSPAWKALHGKYFIEKIRSYDQNSFARVSASTSLVRVTIKCNARSFNSVRKLPSGREIPLTRGKVQMPQISGILGKFGTSLAHTSDLQSGKVIIGKNNKIKGYEKICGPALLFPRVGNPTSGKIAVLPKGQEVVISDCVFALHCKSNYEAHSIRSDILANWNFFKSQYHGTGAPYTTITRSKEILHRTLCSKFILESSFAI